MGALTLIIIRHGEKPGESWPGPGLTNSGTEDRKSLVVRGWQRAGAWAALFGAGLGGSDYPAPQRIYAADPDAPGTPDRKSNKRMSETVMPLAERLGLTIQLNFGKGDEKALVEELLALSGVVLVCWDHEGIAGGIVPRIPIVEGNSPFQWPDQRYDIALRFDRGEGMKGFAYRQLSPRLLSDDSEARL